MEVHHHPHVEKKSFKEYLLEGLMIFFAVSMGFIAENIRESISENHKAQELAESLYKEVKSDSVQIQEKIQFRSRKIDQMIYLRNTLRDSSLEHLGSRFGLGMYWTTQIITLILFEPQDGILSQLKTSGNLKFYKTTELQNSIGSYSAMINRLRNRNQQEYNVVDNFIRKMSMQYFDYKWLEKVTDSGGVLVTPQGNLSPCPEYPFDIQNKNTFNRQEAVGIVSQYILVVKGTSELTYQEFRNRNHELLQALRNNYHLEKE